MGLKPRGRYSAHSVSAFEITRFSRARRGGEKVPGGATGGGNDARNEPSPFFAECFNALWNGSLQFFLLSCGTTSVNGWRTSGRSSGLGRMMHRPIAEQGLYLKRVMNGFLNYFAVPTNSRAINSFYRHVGWYWCRALRRRSQISRLTWLRMKRLTDLWLPPARIRHPLPGVRRRHERNSGAVKVWRNRPVFLRSAYGSPCWSTIRSVRYRSVKKRWVRSSWRRTGLHCQRRAWLQEHVF